MMAPVSGKNHIADTHASIFSQKRHGHAEAQPLFLLLSLLDDFISFAERDLAMWKHGHFFLLFLFPKGTFWPCGSTAIFLGLFFFDFYKIISCVFSFPERDLACSLTHPYEPTVGPCGCCQ